MPFAWPEEKAAQTDRPRRAEVFDQILTANSWNNPESLSGSGSTLQRTAQYRASLLELIRKSGWTTFFDAPCGDLNWMPELLQAIDIEYLGADISALAIEAAKRRLPTANLRTFDICVDPFPKADVWHCRDCLFHLSHAECLAALRNFASSEIPFALITSNTARWLKNIDIRTGNWRLLDLERAPFSLPPPILRLNDFPTGREFPRYVCLWSRDQIASRV